MTFLVNRTNMNINAGSNVGYSCGVQTIGRLFTPIDYVRLPAKPCREE